MSKKKQKTWNFVNKYEYDDGSVRYSAKDQEWSEGALKELRQDGVIFAKYGYIGLKPAYDYDINGKFYRIGHEDDGSLYFNKENDIFHIKNLFELAKVLMDAPECKM